VLLRDAKDGPSPRQTIADTLARVMLQVEYDCLADMQTRRVDPFYQELCLIVAEVFVMDPESVMRINGAATAAGLVQEIYARLCCEHVRLVFDNFQDVSRRVHNKKAYLRTALYNAVFELESYLINDSFCD